MAERPGSGKPSYRQIQSMDGSNKVEEFFARPYMARERETLDAVIQARNSAITAEQKVAANPSDPAAISEHNQAEAQLGGVLGRLFALSEAYPDLKANQNMLALHEELTSTENRIGFARQAFNDAAATYNIRREVFPSVTVAGMFGFKQAALLATNLAAVRSCQGPAGHTPAAPPGPCHASLALDVAPPTPGFRRPDRDAHARRPAADPVRVHPPLCAASPSRRPVPAAVSDASGAQLTAKSGAAGSTVLALLAWEGEPQPDQADRAFDAGMRSFIGGDHTHRLPPREECSLAEFDAALQPLKQSVPAIKCRIVVACTACILGNQQVTVREAELLRAICDMLDCPLPPLLVGEAEGG
jgi:hypothetical protein